MDAMGARFFFCDPDESWAISASPDSNTGYESTEREIIQDSPDEFNHSEGKSLPKVLQYDLRKCDLLRSIKIYN